MHNGAASPSQSAAPATPLSTPALLLLAVESMGLFLGVWGSALFQRRATLPQTLRHALVLLLLLPVFLLYQLGTWLAHGLDAIFFRGYRSTQFQTSLFIVGMPRSGTTYLHRVLAQDEQAFTTMRAWETVLAPAVCQKKLLLGLLHLDRQLGGHVRALLLLLETRLSAGTRQVHALSLRAPEEDFIVLVPAMACFALIAVFPESNWLWQLARFDQAVSPGRRARLAAFYQACIQKHGYVFGTEAVFLSKNASFASWQDTLARYFPGSQHVCCVRDPQEGVPSQLSALEPTMRLIGNDVRATLFRDQIIDMLTGYYGTYLEQAQQAGAASCLLVRTPEIKQHLDRVVQDIYARCGLAWSDKMAHRLEHEAAQSRTHKSQHAYSLQDFDCTPDDIQTRFAGRSGKTPFAGTAHL